MIGTLMARRNLAGAFEALRRHDLDAFLAAWRDDAVFVYPGDVPESGTFGGKVAIEAWFRRYFQQFPETLYDVTNICVRNCCDLVGNNLLTAEWSLRLVNRDGREGHHSGVAAVTCQGGKVIAVKDYLFDTGDAFRKDWGAL
jgi:uncharacterized protein